MGATKKEKACANIFQFDLFYFYHSNDLSDFHNIGGI